jgi:diphosphomevalonate decarboxylase
MFTLDAGANVHLLYPEMEKTNVQNFIANELVQHCENGLFYDNKIGTGPSLIV